ncbi:MAG: uL15m family ribosomal protein [Nanoarchaeota archaeon]
MKQRRKKNIRSRGSNSHGWGAKKKHRGAGSRGGRGRSGSGKRGDQKKPSYWKYEKPGKVGFTSKVKPQLTITLRDIETTINELVKHGHAKQEGQAYTINLTALGYNKLISRGNIKYTYHITIPHATERAKAKIEKNKGTITHDGRH